MKLFLLYGYNERNQSYLRLLLASGRQWKLSSKGKILGQLLCKLWKDTKYVFLNWFLPQCVAIKGYSPMSQKAENHVLESFNLRLFRGACHQTPQESVHVMFSFNHLLSSDHTSINFLMKTQYSPLFRNETFHKCEVEWQ